MSSLFTRRWHCSTELVIFSTCFTTVGTRVHFLSSEYTTTCCWSYFTADAPFSLILYSIWPSLCDMWKPNGLRVGTYGFILKRSLMAPGVLAPAGLGCSPSHLASVQVIWTAVLGVTTSAAGDCGVAGVGGLVLLSPMSCSCGGWDTVTRCRGRARYNTYMWTVWGQRKEEVEWEVLNQRKKYNCELESKK